MSDTIDEVFEPILRAESKFFYISRDYSSYINDVHEYNNLLEVFDSIIETKTKTLVFVYKTFDGATEKELFEKFTAKNKKLLS